MPGEVLTVLVGGGGATWLGGAGPTPTANDSITFDGTTNFIPNLEQSYSVFGVTFAQTAGQFNLVGAQLTIGAGGIAQESTTIGENIATSGVVLGDTQTWDVASGGLDVSAPISGGGDLTKTGAGTLTLTGNNSWTGTTTVEAGTPVIRGVGNYGTISSTGSGSTLNFDFRTAAETRALNDGIVNIYGGTVAVDASTGGTANVYGGAIVCAFVGDPAAINIYGGDFSGGIANLDPTDSIIDIFGSDYTLGGPTVNGNFVDWDLTGTLSDGETLNTQYVASGDDTSSAQGLTLNGAASAPSAIALLPPDVLCFRDITRKKTRARN